MRRRGHGLLLKEREEPRVQGTVAPTLVAGPPLMMPPTDGRLELLAFMLIAPADGRLERSRSGALERSQWSVISSAPSSRCIICASSLAPPLPLLHTPTFLNTSAMMLS